MQVLTAPSQC